MKPEDVTAFEGAVAEGVAIAEWILMCHKALTDNYLYQAWYRFLQYDGLPPYYTPALEAIVMKRFFKYGLPRTQEALFKQTNAGLYIVSKAMGPAKNLPQDLRSSAKKILVQRGRIKRKEVAMAS